MQATASEPTTSAEDAHLTDSHLKRAMEGADTAEALITESTSSPVAAAAGALRVYEFVLREQRAGRTPADTDIHDFLRRAGFPIAA
ncbi:hypothetical protein [Rhodococcus sp. HNM0569]|uniref:hypothetical protein n=1 Tax=Rhodococcus sp. HNM0569 TaxID=2716340 RepID=UPI00146A737C|nr:hypothetical protein [Rhodococcus sp. HNM0569]NLU82158.1 hypothetical protein [Rhodococcus sp. HNM0569]